MHSGEFAEICSNIDQDLAIIETILYALKFLLAFTKATIATLRSARKATSFVKVLLTEELSVLAEAKEHRLAFASVLSANALTFTREFIWRRVKILVQGE